MTSTTAFNFLKLEDINDLPQKLIDIIFSNERDRIYNELSAANNYDFSYDWFQGIYEDELAQRNQNKQDFTPSIVGVLLSHLTGVVKGKIYEPTAGNGSLLISNWNYRRTKLGNDFNSNEHPVECWELSARSIPILLFNLSIRGILGEVYHGDVLTKEIKSKYELAPSNQYSIIKKVENYGNI